MSVSLPFLLFLTFDLAPGGHPRKRSPLADKDDVSLAIYVRKR